MRKTTDVLTSNQTENKNVNVNSGANLNKAEKNSGKKNSGKNSKKNNKNNNSKNNNSSNNSSNKNNSNSNSSANKNSKKNSITKNSEVDLKKNSESKVDISKTKKSDAKMPETKKPENKSETTKPEETSLAKEEKASNTDNKSVNEPKVEVLSSSSRGNSANNSNNGINQLIGALDNLFYNNGKLNLKQFGKIFGIITGVFLVMLLILWKTFCRGGLIFANRVITAWNMRNGSMYYEYITGSEHGRRDLLIFFALILMAVCIISAALYVLKKPVYSLIMLYCLFALPALAMFSHSKMLVLVGLVVLVSVLLFMRLPKNNLKKNLKFVAAFVVVVGLISLATMKISSNILKDDSDSLQANAIKRISEKIYGTSDTPEGNIKEASVRDTSRSDRLVVDAEKEGLVYLRGYTGSIFDDGQWTDLDKEVYSVHYKDMLHYMNENDFSSLTTLSNFYQLSNQYIEGSFTYDAETLKVSNVGASDKYIYMPYTCDQASFKYMGEMNKDLNLKNSYSNILKNYEFSCAVTDENQMISLYDNGALTNAQYQLSGYGPVDTYEEGPGAFDTEGLDDTAGFEEDLSSEDGTADGAVETASSGNATADVDVNYLNLEQAYHEFADAYYMDIPEDAKTAFDVKLQPIDTEVGVELITRYIREYLKENLEYNEDVVGNLSKVTGGQAANKTVANGTNQTTANQTAANGTSQNASSQTTNINKMDSSSASYILSFGKGYSIHYATLATLMYRYYGVPARYVEGYRCDLKAGTNKVTAKDAHAWVEVYRYGMGWVPIDVTPGFYEEGDSSEMEMQSESMAPNAGGGSDQEATTEQPKPQEQPEEEEEESLPAWVAILLFFVVLIVMAIAYIFIRAYIVRKKIRESFEDKDYKKAVLSISKSLWNLLKIYDIDIDDGLPIKNKEKLDETFAQDTGVSYKEVDAVLNKAKYSSHEVTEKEYGLVRKYYDDISNFISKKTKLPTKLIWKYIYCALSLVLMISIFTGCDKQTADYELGSVFAYNNIQETKVSDEVLDDSYADILQDDSFEPNDETEETPGSPADSMPSNKTPDSRQNNTSRPPIANRTNNNDNDGNNDGQNAPADTTASNDSNGSSDSPSGGNGGNNGNGGSGGNGGNGSGGSNGTGSNGSGGNGGNEKKQPEKTAEAYGLEYSGDLGRYIWGEAVDTSNLHIYYTAEGGKKEITDYNIEMNYPAIDTSPLAISTAPSDAGVDKTYDTYQPGIYIADVTYGEYYVQVPYELDVAYITINFHISNYCTDPDNHRYDIETDEDGLDIEKYSANSIYDDSCDMSSIFPGYNYCKYCSSTTYTTEQEEVYYDEVVGDTTIAKSKWVDMTTYRPQIISWKVMYPITGDYSFTRDEFNALGITEDYTTYASYNYDTMDISKSSMMSVEWLGDYCYSAGTYVDYYVVVPEDVTIN